MKMIELSSADAGNSYRRMISRAYHDCLFMAMVCSSPMIFIPCSGGLGHRPEECIKPDIGLGIELVARNLARLSD